MGTKSLSTPVINFNGSTVYRVGYEITLLPTKAQRTSCLWHWDGASLSKTKTTVCSSQELHKNTSATFKQNIHISAIQTSHSSWKSSVLCWNSRLFRTHFSVLDFLKSRHKQQKPQANWKRYKMWKWFVSFSDYTTFLYAFLLSLHALSHR